MFNVLPQFPLVFGLPEIVSRGIEDPLKLKTWKHPIKSKLDFVKRNIMWVISYPNNTNTNKEGEGWGPLKESVIQSCEDAHCCKSVWKMKDWSSLFKEYFSCMNVWTYFLEKIKKLSCDTTQLPPCQFSWQRYIWSSVLKLFLAAWHADITTLYVTYKFDRPR